MFHFDVQTLLRNLNSMMPQFNISLRYQACGFVSAEPFTVSCKVRTFCQEKKKYFLISLQG